MSNTGMSNTGISTVSWPSGPPSAAVAELLTSLELLVTRRVDGYLHGHYQGLTPGQGSEPGEARSYQAGDDVRRIDWNVTARTRELHVRDQIADRDLEAWLVVDTSPTMRFGTARSDKLQVALGVTAAIGFLTARHQNRVGAVLVSGPELRTLPARPGRDQVRAILQAVASSPDNEGRGRADLGAALHRVGAINRRRGFVAVIADFLAPGWQHPLGTLALRHDVLAAEILDPRELELPPVGQLVMADPATGRRREVRLTPKVRRDYAAAAAAQRDEIRQSFRRIRADHLQVRTDEDWLAAVVAHVGARRARARAQVVRT
jgi:uncharacterized protein (DUF58 family)